MHAGYVWSMGDSMKLIFPKNIFSSILNSVIPDELKKEVLYNESSLICKSLEYHTSAVALIPTLDLVNHRNLFVSQKIGISFDGVLSNAYFYFIEKEKSMQKLFLRGDVSINEILLSKIIFKELYSSPVDITLDTNKTLETNRDYIIAGDENFCLWNYQSSISIADEVSNLIDLPYVNFVFASPDKDSLIEFNKQVAAINIDKSIEENIGNILANLDIPTQAKEFVKENMDSIYFEMTGNEEDALNELIKLVFYHGIINDIFDVKFV
jgi:hypothetical protein